MPDTSHIVSGHVARVVILTLDNHLKEAAAQSERAFVADGHPIRVSLHAAVDYTRSPLELTRTIEDIKRADILIIGMLFIEDHIKPVLEALQKRAPDCDAVVGLLSGGEIIKLTHMGRLQMGKEAKGPLALLKRLRGSKQKDGNRTSGAGQMATLKRLPKLLRFIPGTAQDLRAYFLSMQYWLGGSHINFANMVRMLVKRYGFTDDTALRDALSVEPPLDYPEVGLYHPAVAGGVTDQLSKLPTQKAAKGRIGLLVMRSYVLSADTAHYTHVIQQLEAAGMDVIPAFASGLDGRQAIEQYFIDDRGKPTIDVMVSLTGFSLVGGPAYNDSDAATEILARLNVPYIAAHSLEFQSLDDWHNSAQGLSPIESTMMIAIPELDGATTPTVFGGRSPGGPMTAEVDQVARLVERVEAHVCLRRTPKAERKLAVTLFNFPPGGGAAGTAAHLSVFRSLHKTLTALKADGYTVDVPESPDALMAALKSEDPSTPAALRLHTRISRDDHIRREPHLEALEAVWGPAPGEADTDGFNILVHGRAFGNILVTVQPTLGFEGDPMRLMFDGGLAPTHAMSAYYRYLREDYGAHSLLHFGTHGALEFLPGKQAGISQACWPERLIGALPHTYLYAANNPSEGTIAKRRSSATLVSYLTPAIAEAGLYASLSELEDAVTSWSALDPAARTGEEGAALKSLIEKEALALEFSLKDAADPDQLQKLTEDLVEIKTALIPEGLHTLGETMDRAGLLDTLKASARCLAGDRDDQDPVPDPYLEGLVDGENVRAEPLSKAQSQDLASLSQLLDGLKQNGEIPALLNALGGGYVKPSPGGDLIRNPEILPTGRNIHAFDPFRLPTKVAMETGERAARLLLDRYHQEKGRFPKRLAIVLWGTDTIKTGGDPIAQVLALIGARPRLDSYGRVAGADLIPLNELGRPRVDVLLTLSGIFRDLLPLQSKMLADAFWIAARADEPLDMNPIRASVLDAVETKGIDFETAALRVFANADGAYGSNVNMMIDNGLWDDEAELADCYAERKSFAISRTGKVEKARNQLDQLLKTVDATYQNLDSVDLGITTIDHYFDTLGGISKAVSLAHGGEAVPVLVGDHTSGKGRVRTLKEQVALETRSRALNPRWYDSMLEHGFEGVRHIEAAVTNTLGWSATTGDVDPWVYQRLTETYVLDEDMRTRLAELNPSASLKLASRLIEASERSYWQPTAETLATLEAVGDDLEDKLEGLGAQTEGALA